LLFHVRTISLKILTYEPKQQKVHKSL